MSTILRWFHDGEVRYHAYFRSLAPSPVSRQLIIASSGGANIHVTLHQDRQLEDFSDAELVSYARLLTPSGMAGAAAEAAD